MHDVYAQLRMLKQFWEFMDFVVCSLGLATTHSSRSTVRVLYGKLNLYERDVWVVFMFICLGGKYHRIMT